MKVGRPSLDSFSAVSLVSPWQALPLKPRYPPTVRMECSDLELFKAGTCHALSKPWKLFFTSGHGIVSGVHARDAACTLMHFSRILIHFHAFKCIFTHSHAFPRISTHVHARSCIPTHVHAFTTHIHASVYLPSTCCFDYPRHNSGMSFPIWFEVRTSNHKIVGSGQCGLP